VERTRYQSWCWYILAPVRWAFLLIWLPIFLLLYFYGPVGPSELLASPVCPESLIREQR